MDSLKILFLDDHCEDLEAFIKVLQRKNFFVESIDSVDEAIKKIKEMVFDLMIIDLSMSSCPELEEYNDDDNIFTGIKLVGMVRSGSLNKKNSNIPIILSTAMLVNTDNYRLNHNGILNLLKKPYSPSDLLLEINSILGKNTT